MVTNSKTKVKDDVILNLSTITTSLDNTIYISLHICYIATVGSGSKRSICASYFRWEKAPSHEYSNTVESPSSFALRGVAIGVIVTPA